MIQWSQLGFAETMSIAVFAAAVWLIYLFSILKNARLPEALLCSTLLLIGLFCLCLIIYQPQYNISKAGGKALLLTQDVSTVPDSVQVFALPHVRTPATVRKVPDLAFIERNYSEIGQVYIAGYGLEPAQLTDLQRLHVTFLEKKPPAGFNWLSYNKQVTEGEALTVSGTYINPSADTLKLLLSTAEGLQDSVQLPSGEKRFSLLAPSHIPGRYIATLQIAAGDSTRTEILPFVVEARQPLQVLILQGFPSFEMNYLKDWLGQGKHQIQVRARISRDKYATQMINAAQKAGVKPILSEENLAASDLLICDAEGLRQLSAAEKKRIQQAVAQGLGWMILADEEWLKKPEILGHRFSLAPSHTISFVPEQNVQAAQGKAVADKLPAAFAGKSLLVPVSYTRAGELIAAYIPDGKGRVGVQLAAATFPWILQGEKAAYNFFWKEIVQGISRRQPTREIRLTGFPFILNHYPAAFTVTDTLLAPAAIRYTSGMQQQAMPEKGLPGTVETAYRFLPAEEGWIQIGYQGDTTQGYQSYVLPSHAWDDLKKADWWRQQKTTDSAVSTDSTFIAWIAVPPLWFFIPLIAALGLLWWREKQ
jgi:hypothetical protein